MIIDSHSHYYHHNFDGEFPYLCETDGNASIGRSNRETLLSELRSAGVVGFVEPSIGIDDIEKQITVAKAHPSFIKTAIGVHPTRCIKTPWSKRKLLSEYVKKAEAAAIGELGLDYHMPREKQHRMLQKRWFIYQLKLAHKLKLPLVLHIREADRDALKILKRYKNKLHGGVVHCFSGTLSDAREYTALGLCLGIGGKLFSEGERGRELEKTVCEIPLSSLLAETDAPYVIPETWNIDCTKAERKRLCNCSHILPAVIKRIAELRKIDRTYAEDEIYKNTVRLFGAF